MAYGKLPSGHLQMSPEGEAALEKYGARWRAFNDINAKFFATWDPFNLTQESIDRHEAAMKEE